jgi:thiosulfate dehydrogenase (quinone) large subunit
LATVYGPMVAKRSTRVERPAKAVPPQRQGVVAAPPSERRLAYATLPLRFFLGVTFLYAGFQKIADPGFLRPGAPTYIGTQLQAFAPHSPIGFLLESLALPAPQLAGIGVIAAELIIGAAVVLGIATRWAAAAGALLNFVLFLTASWTVQPYFLGSDSIYTVAWITLALIGDQGLYTAGPYLLKELGFTETSAGRRSGFDPSRRRLLLQAGAAAVALVWVLSVLPRTRAAIQVAVTPSPSPSPSPSSPTPGATPSAAPSPTGTKIGALADLKAQGSLTFNDPTTGDPALAVQLSGGNVVAFDAVCTHAGCQVQYDTGQKLFVCPCHGAEFDPAQSAAVVAGPAPTPLGSIKIQVASDGNIYTV